MCVALARPQHWGRLQTFRNSERCATLSARNTEPDTGRAPDTEGLTGAEHGERTPDRINQRNG